MSNDKLSKILTIVAAVIGIIGTIFLIRIIMAGDDEITNSADLQGSIIDPFITFTKIILILVTAAAIVFSILNLVKHPKALKKSIMGLAVMGILLLIAYFTASSDVVTDFTGKVLEESKNASTSKWVSALINFTGLLGLGGLVAIGLGLVKGLVK